MDPGFVSVLIQDPGRGHRRLPPGHSDDDGQALHAPPPPPNAQLDEAGSDALAQVPRRGSAYAPRVTHAPATYTPSDVDGRAGARAGTALMETAAAGSGTEAHASVGLADSSAAAGSAPLDSPGQNGGQASAAPRE